ncbi:hypothetical protein G7074_16575 [Pedobacter sp. HDW13]|uniref:hypothetical protein n=1 Tax=unclassified Pedobacter TaxID=2628915 RepID=UPI000F5B7F26|nr:MULTISPECIES: hypothetical protein [unclassified Pedobacter]QIL40733.1 hypothetical protein G7074_16575 [Pedobacter sp. HDW13]RQO71454.1 hypothetical protein DBR40_16750 [Pedobacter sp. KBW01]
MKIRKYGIWLFLLLVSFGSYAQVQVHTDMRTANWNLIGLKCDKQVKPLVWQAVFPPALKAINHKVIELPGYIIPTRVGNTFTEFMLSVVPIASCPYCGTGDIPSMVEVKMLKPIKWTDTPVLIKGKFEINDSGDSRSTFFLLEAVQK